MNGVRFLLRPGWLGLTAAVVLFAVACFTVLAPWQFRRHDERQARNEAIEMSFHLEPVPLGQVPDGTQWRQVTLTGRYLPEGEALARLRSVLGEPAFEVLTPFELSSGDVVLVDRGFVRPARSAGGGRGNQVPEFEEAPAGQVTVVGRLRRDEGGRDRGVLDDGGHRQVYAIDAATVGEAAGLPIRPGYVQLNAGQPGVLGPLPLPQLDTGPHLAYALQWIAFGLMALAGWVLLVRRERAEAGAPGGRAGSAAARPPATTGANHRGEHG